MAALIGAPPSVCGWAGWWPRPAGPRTQRPAREDADRHRESMVGAPRRPARRERPARRPARRSARPARGGQTVPRLDNRAGRRWTTPAGAGSRSRPAPPHPPARTGRARRTPPRSPPADPFHRASVQTDPEPVCYLLGQYRPGYRGRGGVQELGDRRGELDRAPTATLVVEQPVHAVAVE